MDDRLAPHKRHSKPRKKFAQICGRPPRNPPYCVTDPDDWEVIKDLGKGQLKCHQPDCSVRFQKPMVSTRGLRYLANMQEESCGHGFERPDLGGGPMSREHMWLQDRLAKIISNNLEHEAIIEHVESHADVYVPDARLSIEVQRWSTDFAARTRARQRNGGKVLWLVTETAQGRDTRRALFRLPAARVAVVSRKDHDVKLQPWNHPEQEADAILQIYATAAHRKADGTLTTYPMGPHRFLQQIIDGQRQWYPPGTRGLPRAGNGAWVLVEDLRQVQAYLRAADARRRAERHAALRARDQQAEVTGQPDPEPEERTDSSASEPRTIHGDDTATHGGESVEVPTPTGEAKIPSAPDAQHHNSGFTDESPQPPPTARPIARSENPFLPAPQHAPTARPRQTAWQRFLRWLRGGQ